MLTKIDSSRLLSVSRGKLWARWRRIANLIHANSDNEVANLLLHARWTSQDGRLVGFSCPFGPLGREVLTFCLIFMLVISGSCPLWTSCIFLFVFFFLSLCFIHSWLPSSFPSSSLVLSLFLLSFPSIFFLFSSHLTFFFPFYVISLSAFHVYPFLPFIVSLSLLSFSLFCRVYLPFPLLLFFFFLPSVPSFSSCFIIFLPFF